MNVTTIVIERNCVVREGESSLIADRDMGYRDRDDEEHASCNLSNCVEYLITIFFLADVRNCTRPYLKDFGSLSKERALKILSRSRRFNSRSIKDKK